MTILFPDVSEYQHGLSLTGAPAAILKASQGTGYADPSYPAFRAQAQQLGIPWAAYHWLDTTDGVAQARHCYQVVGPDAVLMVDDEQQRLDITHTLQFVTEYRRLGGTVRLEYAPHWIWGQSGEPDLRPLQRAGLHLIASQYTGYFDNGPGWAAYGGWEPTIWQFTDQQNFNGRRIDFNAFRGTVNELQDLFTPAASEISIVTRGDELPMLIQSQESPDVLWETDRIRRRQVADSSEARQLLLAVDGPIHTVSTDQVLGWVAGPPDAELGGGTSPGTGPSADEVADAVVTKIAQMLARMLGTAAPAVAGALAAAVSNATPTTSDTED